VENLIELVRLGVKLHAWLTLLQIAGALLLITAAFYQFLFFLRLERRLFTIGLRYVGIPPFHLFKTSWLTLVLSGFGILFLCSNGLFSVGNLVMPLSTGGSLSVVYGIWLGRKRNFVVAGEALQLAVELSSHHSRIFGNKKPYSRERHRRVVRPLYVIIAINTLASVGCLIWSGMTTGEDQKLYFQISVVLGLCLLFIIAMVFFLISAVAKK
jgi:hypothetical protein